MSTEAQSRPAASRGRGGGRGGRGGQSRGGAHQQTRTNGDKFDSLDAIEDEGEIGELKRLYGAKTALIKEMFSDWSEVDILFVLQETDGDENLAVTRIADGQASQWGEVSKTKKDRSKSKAPKEVTFTTTTGETAPGYNRPSRGGRDGGRDGGRGRGRATERGGRSTRGRAVSAGANGTHADKSNDLSVPTEESSAWDNAKADETPAWANVTAEAPTAPKSTAPTTASPAPSKPAASTWASMLRQSTAPKPAPVKPQAAPVPQPAETIESLPAVAEPAAEEPEPVEEPPQEPVKEAPAPEPATVVPEVALPPSQDQLTETNLEQITDISHPPETETARSEAADSWDPRTAALSATATPLSASQQQHQNAQSSRPAASGYAATAIKATERAATRTPSYGRRLLDQEEAVRMPTNREVDRATVQFGALNFSGEEDIDGDREEPETRAQPPVDSPVSHPRTSLPVAQPAAVPEPFAAQKPVAAPAATPSAPAVPSAIAPQQPAAMAQAAPQQPPISQPSQPHQGFGRFGQDQHSFGQKPYDAFGQPNMANPPATTQHQYDGFQGQAQAPAQTQPLTQAPAPAAAPAAMSSAPNDYSSFYTADPSSRAPYSGYYGNNFGQQQASQGHQDGSQRSLGAYNTAQADPLSQYPQSGAQAQASSRFGAGSALDSQNSGNNTPQPTGQNQQQAGQNTQTQSQAQQAQHQYPYGGQHPYQYSPYYAAYMNQQYNSAYGQGAYGSGPYGSKGGVYGQPNQYGMNPPYDHGSTGASGFGQSSLHRNDSGLGSGLDYARASAQSANQQGLGSGGFGGGVHDNFGRGSSYQSQAGQGFNNPSQQAANAPSGNDDLKPFGEKAGSGPSPSISGARPISAANNAQSQQGLPPSQSGQQGAAGMGGYGGYPGHIQQQGHHLGQTGAGGFGAGAGQQGHGNNPYGAYGNQGFGGSYYGAQPRGWGNNYH